MLFQDTGVVDPFAFWFWSKKGLGVLGPLCTFRPRLAWGITPIMQFHPNFSFESSTFQSMESRGHPSCPALSYWRGGGTPAQLLPRLLTVRGMVAIKSAFTEFSVEGSHAGQSPVFSNTRRIFSSSSVSLFLNPLRPLTTSTTLHLCIDLSGS